jgi:RND family efflux transporter MFP subunit
LEAVKKYLPGAGKIRLFIWTAAIAVGLILTALQVARRAGELSARTLSLEREDRSSKPVEVMRIRPSALEIWKNCYGEARAAKTMNVTSFVRETVEAIHVNVGDKVRPGQVLLTLRHDDQAASERAGAAAYAEAKRSHERLRALYEEGGVSLAEVDRAYAAMKSEEAKSLNYRSMLKHTQVRSKISGIVTARDVEPGEIAEIGRTLLSVDDPSDIEVQLMISAKDIRRINADTPIKITAGGRPFKGRIRRIGTRAQEGSGLCPVTAAVDPDAGILPGTHLEGSFLVRRETGVIVIPSSAVLDRGGERFVYTVSEDGEKTARLTRIAAGSGKSGRVVVTSGLKPGDLLITSGGRGLSDGISVSCDLSRGGVD